MAFISAPLLYLFIALIFLEQSIVERMIILSPSEKDPSSSFSLQIESSQSSFPFLLEDDMEIIV